MPITLTQQTDLITGASRGIGRGIALKLAEQGVKRIAINYKENDAAAEELRVWAKNHRFHDYVPEWLLSAWRMPVFEKNAC